MPGFCPKCGTIFVDGICPECRAKEAKKNLIIHFANGEKKQLHNVSERDLDEFIKFVGGITKYQIWDYKTTNLRKDDETVYIPRQAITYFETREVTE